MSETETDPWDQFCAVLADKLDVSVDQVRREARFVEDLEADSLDLAALLMELEDRFQIVIPEDQVMQFKTVGAFFDYLRQILDNPAARRPPPSVR